MFNSFLNVYFSWVAILLHYLTTLQDLFYHLDHCCIFSFISLLLLTLELIPINKIEGFNLRKLPVEVFLAYNMELLRHKYGDIMTIFNQFQQYVWVKYSYLTQVKVLMVWNSWW